MKLTSSLACLVIASQLVSLPVRADSAKSPSGDADSARASAKIDYSPPNSSRPFEYSFSKREANRGALVKGAKIRPGQSVKIVAFDADQDVDPQDFSSVGIATPGAATPPPATPPAPAPRKCDIASGTPKCSETGTGRICGNDDDCNFRACQTATEGKGSCVIGGDGAMCDPEKPTACSMKRCRFSDRSCVLGGSGPLCDGEMGSRCFGEKSKFCKGKKCDTHDGTGNWIRCEAEKDCSADTRSFCDPADPGKCKENTGGLLSGFSPCVADSDCTQNYCSAGACAPGFLEWSTAPCSQANAQSPECERRACAASGNCVAGGTGQSCNGTNECGRYYCKTKVGEEKGKCTVRLGGGENLHGCTEEDKDCTRS